MQKIHVFIVFLLSTIFAVQVYGIPDSVVIAPVPDWIAQIKPDASTKDTSYDSEGGIQDLLLHTEVKSDQEETFVHVAYRILSDAGVQNASDVYIPYDPAYQTLSIHKIGIIRADKFEDRLDMDRMKVIQREKDLERNVYDGSLLAYLNLEDIRIGDIIEYSYTTKGMNPIFEHKLNQLVYLNGRSPIGEIIYRLVTPKNKAITIKNFNTTIKPQKSDAGKNTAYTWKVKNTAAIQINDGIPFGYNPFAYIIITEYSSWDSLREWANGLFTFHEPYDAAFTKKAAELKKLYPDKRAYFLEAVRFVQDKIRYMGIEVGEKSHRPNHPNQVLSQRFGDCKDKSALLCALLRENGISAKPVLANFYTRMDLTNYPPSPLAFNHVIVAGILDGKEIWIDPTISYQGGNLETTSIPDYGVGLVVGSNESGGLKDFPSDRDGSVEISEFFTMKDYDRPVELKVSSLYKGLEADSMRFRLANQSQSALVKRFLNYYVTYYPETVVDKPLTIQDDRAKNELRIEESYFIKNLWQKDRTPCAEFNAEYVKQYFALPQERVRTMPLALRHPVHAIENITVSTPEEWSIEPNVYYYDDEFFAFNYKIDYEPKMLKLRFEYQSLNDTIPLEKLPDYMKKAREFEKDCNYGISFKKRK